MFTDISKMAVSQYLALVVASHTKTLILEYTDTDPDSKALKIAAWCFGELVSRKAVPYTDKAVEKAVAWINSKRKKKTAE